MLSDARIRNAKPAPSLYRMFDGARQGLLLEVAVSGSKLWRVQFRSNGRRSLKALGRWPEVSLKEAREKAGDFNRARAGGVTLTGSDPPLKKVDFRKVAKDWADEFLPSLAPRTALRERGFLDNKILPALGDIPPKELTLPLVLDRVLKPIQADGHINTLNKVKIVLSKVFRYAVAHGLMERDFTVDMKGAFPAEKPVHFASITDPVRVGCLLRDIDDYPGSPVVGHALKILPYVFVRPGELRNAEWHEVNLDKAMWRIPSKKMKMKVEHLVPLAPQVIRLLSSLKGLTGGGRLLFPGARTKERPITDMTLTAGLRRIGYEGRELCPHGFRSMASTLLNELGYPTDWVELQLAHRERNKVRAAYNRAEHLDDRKRMMQEWADYLDSLRADVVPPARKTP